MRPLFLASALALAAVSAADNLINIPIGRKVPYGVLRYESRFDQSDLRQYHGFLDYGIDTNFDARLTYDDVNGARRVVSGDVSFNYITPITGISPGLSFGIMDVANRTQDGRRAYMATTYRIGGADLFNPVELTYGVFYGKRPLGFVGIMFPFTEQIRFLAEDDGRRISTGLEWKQNNNLTLRWLFIDSRPQLGVRWQTHL